MKSIPLTPLLLTGKSCKISSTTDDDTIYNIFAIASLTLSDSPSFSQLLPLTPEQNRKKNHATTSRKSKPTHQSSFPQQLQSRNGTGESALLVNYYPRCLDDSVHESDSTSHKNLGGKIPSMSRTYNPAQKSSFPRMELSLPGYMDPAHSAKATPRCLDSSNGVQEGFQLNTRRTWSIAQREQARDLMRARRLSPIPPPIACLAPLAPVANAAAAAAAAGTGTIVSPNLGPLHFVIPPAPTPAKTAS